MRKATYALENPVTRKAIGKAEVYEHTTGAWCWRILSSNGIIVAVSGQTYTTKPSAVGGLNNIRRLLGRTTMREA